MLLAIPCRKSSLSNHFSKAPEIMLWDSQTNTKRILALPEASTDCGQKKYCGHKKYWSKVLQEHKVDAVVVRLIGTNMLSALFKLNMRVLSAPRGFDTDKFDIDRFDVNQLTPVTQIEFARPSAKKNKAHCSGQSTTCSSTNGSSTNSITSGKRASVNRLSSRTMSHLTKVFKITAKTEQ
ncbi:NifB/NifX family molybdenum-iron cluster-binding protein [Vibrio sp. ZSDZ65]|uniref:NifB/NifX family molybdenum-iron cluster-binding protein n=1 Tax=Vibrio qingdaonensis TaxID=2829491 RepID=A0A9X3CNP2_9VIBR|nr:NifB/NifX family molybdenum-iron cluster-binding protein [Vibrio qingdaonensis]MCW8346832.1 NifB/NifX family molybdenum-iron cluster-binding protein [Vibrio qingdaonensis]